MSDDDVILLVLYVYCIQELIVANI